MASQNDFKKFLSNIEPSSTTVQYISSIHNNLREYLLNLCDDKEHYVDSFLSGSYAKHTSIRPARNDSKRDVDIIIVTDYKKSDNSRDIIYELRDVLKKSKKYETASVQRCSIGILMENISIDVVPVIECSDDDDLYYIGDSVSGKWRLTDPKGHKSWSTKINQENEEKYKPIVKIMKWWRRNNCPASIKYPKGIVLEKIIADNLGDPSTTLEEMLIETMGNMVTSYEFYIKTGSLPIICDPSNKIHGNNLLEGYKFEDFCSFIRKMM